jgi:triacylglycerol lipase
MNKFQTAAFLSKVAYYDLSSLKPVCKDEGYSAKMIDKNGAQVLVARNSKELWFAFRGTEPTQINDVAADLKISKNTAAAGGLVHSGFQEELDEIWPSILKELKLNSRLKNPKKIYLTGHSLGAAMATITATRVDAECLYTFGSPRVGGKEFIKQLNCEHHRFVNNNDIVTKVPPQIMGFQHCGEERYFNAYGCERNPTYWQRWKDFFRGMWAGWKQGKFFDSLTDHGMDNYVILAESTKQVEVDK